jgi:N-formylglutamate amidohydrolase
MSQKYGAEDENAPKRARHRCVEKVEPPLLLHVPHASTTIPKEDLQDLLVGTDVMRAEELRLVDWFTDELYMDGMDASAKEKHAVVAPVSRLVVDVERFADDKMEEAAKVGMGATYERTTEGKELRSLTLSRRDELLAKYYWPHHRRLDELAKAMLDSHGRCVVLDCHSFPVKPLPTQTAFLEVSPEICVGTDPKHTSPQLRDLVVGHFRSNGFDSVMIDVPFAGALVPNAFFGKDFRLQSVMVELRRDLYMNEATGEREAAGFSRLQSVLSELRAKLKHFAAEGTCNAWAST